MADNTNINMNKQEDEKSFFKLCEFERLQVDKYVIYHNLNQWGLSISCAQLKGYQIQLQITVPYCEMNLDIEEKMCDPEFFDKNIAKLFISNKATSHDGLLNYITNKTVNVLINTHIQYLIFSTPYFYPHNWYTMSNKDYLYKKICYSINYLESFIKAYKGLFQNGVPLIHIKKTQESRNHYVINIILKEYLTISYVKTDTSTSTIYFHLLLEASKRNSTTANHVSKYHEIKITIPREIRIGIVDFKFTANMIE